MKPEIKAEWVAALRSGEYQQGKDWLESDGKFCCLGVLCSIAVQKGDLQREQYGNTVEYVRKEDMSSTKILPTYLYDLAGLTGAFSVKGKNYTLAGLNDEGFTFDQIADIIEYFF